MNMDVNMNMLDIAGGILIAFSVIGLFQLGLAMGKPVIRARRDCKEIGDTPGLSPSPS